MPRSRRHRLPAPPAVKKRFALLDSQQRDKKQAEVVIDLLGDRLIQAAPGAAPGRTVQCPGFGLNARDEKTHRGFLGLIHDLCCKWGIYFIKINF